MKVHREVGRADGIMEFDDDGTKIETTSWADQMSISTAVLTQTIGRNLLRTCSILL
jgi:hypothetical protein